MSVIFGSSKRNRSGHNRWRYINDANIEAPENKRSDYEIKRCKYWAKRHCYRLDPTSHRIVPLHFITTGMYICDNCRQREKIDRWFANLERTEIPSTLPQFRTLKGRLIADSKDYYLHPHLPANDNACWQFYSMLEDLGQIE